MATRTPTKKINKPTRKTSPPAKTFLTPRIDDVRRTSTGLREALFQEIESLRAGHSDAPRAMAVAKLAQQIMSSVRVEIEFAGRVGKSAISGQAPKPLQLTESQQKTSP